MEKIKIEINEQKCLGCEICTTICPEMFTQAIDGVVKVKHEFVLSDLLQLCYHAEECCPSQAIRLVSPNVWDSELSLS
ncbi:MAG: ferredoxin [Sedimentisphaeraceae bacterium JB056]